LHFLDVLTVIGRRRQDFGGRATGESNLTCEIGFAGAEAAIFSSRSRQAGSAATTGSTFAA